MSLDICPCRRGHAWYTPIINTEGNTMSKVISWYCEPTRPSVTCALWRVREDDPTSDHASRGFDPARHIKGAVIYTGRTPLVVWEGPQSAATAADAVAVLFGSPRAICRREVAA